MKTVVLRETIFTEFYYQRGSRSLTGGAAMRVQTLMFPFLLSLTLGFLVVLMPLHASAQCTCDNPCGCDRCGMKEFTDPPCQCPGECGCPTCASDSDAVQFRALTTKDMADTSSIIGSLTFPVTKLDVTERVMALMSGGKCLRAKAALSLLGNARDALKFVPVRFDEKKTLALLD